MRRIKMRILGLFLKTYDYYEWKDLIAVSTDFDKLEKMPDKDKLKGLYSDAPIAYSANYSKELARKETPHYVIEEVKVL
jgi:hypothetical protein